MENYPQIEKIKESLKGVQARSKAAVNIYVGMSGGVDSSVVAVVLKRLGYDVKGVYLNCWGDYEGCTSREDYLSALEVASKFNIPLEIWDFKDEYEKEVLKPFYESYNKGETPNPDILCNYKVKFGSVLEKVLKINENALYATGHYARIKSSQEIYVGSSENLKALKIEAEDESNEKAVMVGKTPSGRLLFSGKDKSKDQSYFLYQIINNTNLDKVIFPLGDLTKNEVRELAKKLDIPSQSKPDSQGICFIGDVDIKDFLKDRVNATKGLVLDVNGDLIGSHPGATFFTVGQRHGFQIGKYIGKPMYVIKKNVKQNTLTVGDKSLVYRCKFHVEQGLFITKFQDIEGLAKKGLLSVRIRNLGKHYKISGLKLTTNTVYSVKTSEEIFAVAPGQSAVFYLDDLVLGGGIIVSH